MKLLIKPIVITFNSNKNNNMQTNRTNNSKSNSFNHHFQKDPYDYPSPLNQTPKIQAHVFKFSQIPEYERINGPSMSQEKRDMIEEKLELEKKAKDTAIARMKKKNQYINYQKNPFVVKETNVKSQELMYGERNFNSKDVAKMVAQGHSRLENEKNHGNIVEAMNDLKMRDPNKVIGKIHRQKLDVFEKLPNQIKQTVMIEHNFKQPKKQNKDSMFFMSMLMDFKQDITFDEIVQLEDENYYDKNQVPINIFQFMKGNHEPFLTDKILDKFFFNHLSTIDKVSRFRFPILRDISRVSRRYIKDYQFKHPGRLDHISSKEATLRVKEISLEDVLGVASGRMTPGIVYKAINQIELKDETSALTEISIDTIAYDDQHHNNHRGFEHVSGEVERQQIKDYLALVNSKAEDRYKQKCEIPFKITQELMKKKINLHTNTIRDREIHKEIKKNVDKQLDYMISMDYVREPVEKKIRHNKVEKNRNEHTKIRALLKTIELKNREEAKIKMLLDGADKR